MTNDRCDESPHEEVSAMVTVLQGEGINGLYSVGTL